MDVVDSAVSTVRDDPAKWSSLALSALVHLLLIGALFVGMQWKSQPLTAVEVEVWRPAEETALAGQAEPKPAPEPAPAPKSAPKPEPKLEPKPVPKPEPRPVPKPEPRPEPKPEPRPAPRAPLKADIPLKEDKKLKEPKKDESKIREAPRKDEPKSREAPRKEESKSKEPVKKDAPKREEPKTREAPSRDPSGKVEQERLSRRDEELKRDLKQVQQQKAEQERLSRSAEADAEARQLKQQRDEQAASQRVRSRDFEAWKEKVRGKIRGNINLPPGIQGNPEAIISITQLPSGEVLDVKVSRSSGNQTLDAAVVNAIKKSSPLPKPTDPELFKRTFAVNYRPRDD